MQAIETIHSGWKFRSRLEARWSVFFETLDVEYRYEPEGFELGDGIRYLPDFYLPKLKVWIEIKPDLPSKEEREKAIRLSLAIKESVVIFAGNVWLDVQGFGFQPLQQDCINYIKHIVQEEQIVTHYLSKDEMIVCKGKQIAGIDFERNYSWSNAMWVECRSCGNVYVNTLRDRACICTSKTLSNISDQLALAYIAARQARFEHGEGR